MTSIKQVGTALIFLAGSTLGGCAGDDPIEAEESTSENTSALASDCEGGANGFIDIPDDLVGTSKPRSVVVAKAGSLPLVVASLEVGVVAGAQRGWALIGGITLPGDRVWMDWTANGGRNWLQCGPFEVSRNIMLKTSAAKRTNPISSLWQFRACGRRPGLAAQCTDWW